ncbi:hypothetical protein ACXA0I_004822, partial [Escherichia coli]
PTKNLRSAWSCLNKACAELVDTAFLPKMTFWFRISIHEVEPLLIANLFAYTQALVVISRFTGNGKQGW